MTACLAGGDALRLNTLTRLFLGLMNGRWEVKDLSGVSRLLLASGL